MNLGETIYKYRISKNLSQGDLAEMLDVSRQSVSKWENNSATPDLDKIVKLCEIFGISIDELVKGEERSAGSQSPILEQAVDSEQAPYQADMHVAPKTDFSGRKIAGTILLCMAFLIILLLTIMGSFAGGLLFAIPFVVCAAICFIFKHNVGLWCSWAVYFLIDMYLRVATGGANRNSIFNIIFYRESGPTSTWYLISGWVLFLTLGLLTAITVLRFKNKPLEMTRKTRNLLITGTVTAVAIKILQMILPMTAYYSYLLAHLISLSGVHSILYALVDWIKVGIVVALMVAFARYRFKPAVIISVSIIALSTIMNFTANYITSNKITQHNENNNGSVITGFATYGKSIYEHGLDIVSMLEEITNSEEYVQAFSGSEEILNVIKGISEGNYEVPQTVYKITFDMDNVLKTSDMLDIENASEALIVNLKNRVLGTIITGINSRGGVTNLAATSVCTAGKTFVSNEIQEEMIYLYTYEGAAPVAVTFTLGENNTVSASGNYLLYDELPAGSVQELLEYFGAYSVEIEVVTE